jgi:hypothetical protein
VTLQNSFRRASWYVAPLESHNISKHITDVMTLFRIHYFSLTVRLVGTRKYFMQIKAIPFKVCVFPCVFYSLYPLFFFQLVRKHYLMFQLREMTMFAMNKLRCKGMKVSFRLHISMIFSCLWNIIYANSLFPLGMPDGDAMEDIVDELGEDKVTEESCKLFSFFDT